MPRPRREPAPPKPVVPLTPAQQELAARWLVLAESKRWKLARRFGAAIADECISEFQVTVCEAARDVDQTRHPEEQVAFLELQLKSAIITVFRKKRPRGYRYSADRDDAPQTETVHILEADRYEFAEDADPTEDGELAVMLTWLRDAVNQLTPLQAEIIRSVAAGEEPSEIGRRLGISRYTVRRRRDEALEWLCYEAWRLRLS